MDESTAASSSDGSDGDDRPPVDGNTFGVPLTHRKHRLVGRILRDVCWLLFAGVVVATPVLLIYATIFYVGFLPALGVMLVMGYVWFTARRAGYTLSRTWHLFLAGLEAFRGDPAGTLRRGARRTRQRARSLADSRD
jgi:hypothetical protein